MTFQNQAWIDDDDDALDDLCTVETGTVLSPTTYAGVPCMHVPPSTEDKDVTLQVLLKDLSGLYQVGCRVIYEGERYVMTRLSRDGVYVKLVATDWPETI